MPLSLMPLPYADTALAPAISAQTLSFHHGKHHKGYIDKVNASVKGTELDGTPLEEIIPAARDKDPGLFNNAAQSWNHGFFWYSLCSGGKAPSGDLAGMIDGAFGSLDALAEELKDKGADHFGSGWVWLVADQGKLAITDTHDGDTLADRSATPLLVIDLWEHAYYLDHQNARPDYLKAVIDKLDWDFAAENLARDRVWTCPT